MSGSNVPYEIPRHVKMEAVPENIILGGCPLSRMKMIKLSKCLSCEYHDGFVQVAYEGDFSRMYQTLCCHATAKELREIE